MRKRYVSPDQNSISSSAVAGSYPVERTTEEATTSRFTGEKSKGENKGIIEQMYESNSQEVSVASGVSTASAIVQDRRAQLAQRFDALHELIYRRGGVRPVNAAIDELCKLLLLRVHVARYPSTRVGDVMLATLFDTAWIRAQGRRGVENVRAAFDIANRHPDYQWRTNGDTGFFIEGDTLRLTDTELLAEAVSLASEIPVQGEKAPWSATHIEQDAVGLAFEVFLRGRYQHAGGLGTYLTPEPVVEAMTRMALSHVTPERLSADDLLIGDPCCGTGRFLISAMRQAEDFRRQGATAGGDANVASRLAAHLFGADQSDSSLLKARLNFLMYGMRRPHLVHVDDSITAAALHELFGRFDVVLTNPPFGGGKYDRPEGLAVLRRDDLRLTAGWNWPRADPLARRPAERIDPAMAFLDFDLSLLRPGGVLGIVLPDGILGPKYAAFHDALFLPSSGQPPKAELLAYVSLPRQTFALSGTAAKTSFLICRRLPSRSSKTVFVAHPKHVGYIQRGPQLIPDPEGNDLPKVADAYLQPTAGPTAGVFTRRVPAREVARDIQIAQRREPAVQDGQDGVAVSALVRTRRSRARARDAHDPYFLSILHVGTDCLVDWLSAGTYSPKTPGRECYPGDVLVSCLNPQIPRITLIPPQAGPGLCSAEFAVLEPTGVDGAHLALLLRSPAITSYLAAAGRGTSSSRRRIDASRILEALVPRSLLSLDPSVVATFRSALETDHRTKVELATVLGYLQS